MTGNLYNPDEEVDSQETVSEEASEDLPEDYYTLYTTHNDASQSVVTNSHFTKMSLVQKFKKNISLLTQAAEGTIELDYKNPKLYKKVLRYYEDRGVEFYEDPYDTYELVVDLLKEDLITEGVSV